MILTCLCLTQFLLLLTSSISLLKPMTLLFVSLQFPFRLPLFDPLTRPLNFRIYLFTSFPHFLAYFAATIGCLATTLDDLARQAVSNGQVAKHKDRSDAPNKVAQDRPALVHGQADHISHTAALLAEGCLGGGGLS